MVAKNDMSKLGAPTDTERFTSRTETEDRVAISDARKEIFDSGYAVDSTKVEDLLKPRSLVPTLVRFFPFALDVIAHVGVRMCSIQSLHFKQVIPSASVMH